MKKRQLGIGLLACLLASLVIVAAAQAGAPLPQKIYAMGSGLPSGVGNLPGNPSDSIMFYDVTDIGHGATSGVFNNDPLFSVWMGFEEFTGELNDAPEGISAGNREEISALTFNPANGTIYVASFDSGTAPAVDIVGDTQGDWDLYRIDYQAILKDFVDNSRPKGTIYGRPLSIVVGDEEFLESIASPLWDGVNDGLAHNVHHPSDPAGTNTVHVPGSFVKVGELGKQVPVGPSFFDSQIDFINPETMVFLDASSGVAPDSPEILDYNIRLWTRVSTSPGFATPPPFGPFDPPSTGKQNQEGGFNTGVLNTESWNSKIAGRLALDLAAESSPTGWALVKHNGTIGIWAADSDGGGDDIAFYELDLVAGTATKKELANTPDGGPFVRQFGLAENPNVDATTNDAEIDQLFVNKNGDLVIVESGFFDTTPGSFTPPTGNGGETAEEPRVITIAIADYDSPDSNGSTFNEVRAAGPAGTGFDDPDAYSVTAPIPITGAIDNDTEVTNTTRAGYDKSTGYIYIIDQDGIDEDLYVFDPATGTIVYSELTLGSGDNDPKPFNPGLFNEGTQIIFTRGDINGDGVVTYADIQALQDGIADNTLGGTVTAAVGAEWYDLTSDGVLDAADLTEMLDNILGTALGDFNLDGFVDGKDFLEWQIASGSSFDGGDLADWEANYGFSNMAPLAAASEAVPEPSSVLLLSLALGFASLGRRRR